MNKYLWVGSLMVAAVAVDLGTKTLAEDRLASRTEDYQHYLHIDVPESASGQTMAEFLDSELGWNSPEEVEEIANSATFIVDDQGDVTGRGSANRSLTGGERIEIQYRTVTLIDGFLSLRYVENRGAAWGLLQNSGHSFRQPFFIVVGIVAIVVIFFLVRSAAPDRMLLLTALALIVGGAIGNIVDRIRYGYVVDFILWYPGFEWPTFNVADSFIVVGVALMFIEVIRDGLRARRAQATSS